MAQIYIRSNFHDYKMAEAKAIELKVNCLVNHYKFEPAFIKETIKRITAKQWRRC